MKEIVVPATDPSLEFPNIHVAKGVRVKRTTGSQAYLTAAERAWLDSLPTRDPSISLRLFFEPIEVKIQGHNESYVPDWLIVTPDWWTIVENKGVHTNGEHSRSQRKIIRHAGLETHFRTISTRFLYRIGRLHPNDTTPTKHQRLAILAGPAYIANPIFERLRFPCLN